MLDLLIIGAGGFGRAVAEAVLLGGQHHLAGFVDDRWPDLEPIWDRPILGRLADLASLRDRAHGCVVAIGDNTARRSAFEAAVRAGFVPASIVHPRAWVSPRARLANGALVMAGAIVGTEASLEAGVIVNAAAVVDHHARVGAFAHLGVGARMAGGAVLGAGAWIQEGCTVPPGQTVGPGAIVRRPGP